jgi:hypothetical protein
MATTRDRTRPEGSEQVEEIQRQIGALTDASIERHRLARGTPAYAAALEAEEQIADRVWRLGTALHAKGEPGAGRPSRSGRDP